MELKCSECGEKAVWEYTPSSRELGYCDNCIPRGCSCSIGEIDEQGREYPCCEYDYYEGGFDIPLPLVKPYPNPYFESGFYSKYNKVFYDMLIIRNNIISSIDW